MTIEEKVDTLYKEALSIAEDMKSYIESNVHEMEDNNESLNSVRILSWMTPLIVSIISYLMLNKAYIGGEISREVLTQNYASLLSNISPRAELEIKSKEMDALIAKVDNLFLRVKGLIVN